MSSTSAARNEIIRIDDMKEACGRILQYMTGLDQLTFLEDTMRQDAVVKNIENIGEAATHLTQAFKDQHKSIQWQYIIAMRNRLVHDYGHVDPEVVWQTAQHDIPDLLGKLRSLPLDLG